MSLKSIFLLLAFLGSQADSIAAQGLELEFKSGTLNPLLCPDQPAESLVLQVRSSPGPISNAKVLKEAVVFANFIRINCADRIKSVTVVIQSGRYDFSSLPGMTGDSDGWNPNLLIVGSNITLAGAAESAPPSLEYSGAGPSTGHGRILIMIGKNADSTTLRGLIFRGDHSFQRRKQSAYYAHATKLAPQRSAYGMVVVGENPNLSKQPSSTRIENCQFLQINYRGILVQSRDVLVEDSYFEGIASASDQLMNLEFAAGSAESPGSILSAVGQAFDDNPGMDFNSGVSFRTHVALSRTADLKIFSGIEVSLLEPRPVEEMIFRRNHFKNLIEGIVGGINTGYPVALFRSRIAEGFVPKAPTFNISDNFFDTISDHALYLSNRIENSRIEGNYFFRCQQVVIKLTSALNLADSSAANDLNLTLADTLKIARFPGAIRTNISKNVFIFSPNYLVTLSGSSNQVSRNRVFELSASCDPSGEAQIYSYVTPAGGRYHHLLLYNKLEADSREGMTVSNFSVNNDALASLPVFESSSWSATKAKQVWDLVRPPSCKASVLKTKFQIAVLKLLGSQTLSFSNQFSGDSQEIDLWMPRDPLEGNAWPNAHAIRLASSDSEGMACRSELPITDSSIFGARTQDSNKIPFALASSFRSHSALAYRTDSDSSLSIVRRKDCAGWN